MKAERPTGKTWKQIQRTNNLEVALLVSLYAILSLKKSHRITFFEALEHIDSAALQVQRC